MKRYFTPRCPKTVINHIFRCLVSLQFSQPCLGLKIMPLTTRLCYFRLVLLKNFSAAGGNIDQEKIVRTIKKRSLFTFARIIVQPTMKDGRNSVRQFAKEKGAWYIYLLATTSRALKPGGPPLPVQFKTNHFLGGRERFCALR